MHQMSKLRRLRKLGKPTYKHFHFFPVYLPESYPPLNVGMPQLWKECQN